MHWDNPTPFLFLAGLPPMHSYPVEANALSQKYERAAESQGRTTTLSSGVK